MGELVDLASAGERRRAMRVPVRGVAVMHGSGGYGLPVHGTLENLSQTGALVNVPSPRIDFDVELELRLAEGAGWVGAHAVRIEPTPRNQAPWQVAVAFDRVDAVTRASINASIETAVSAARHRPILVIDDRAERRARLIDRLVDRGMTPLAPRTPLEVIDLMTRAQLHIGLCLLAPGFGVRPDDLAELLLDSFPWVATSAISDDLDATVERAIAAWSTTSVARLGVAID